MRIGRTGATLVAGMLLLACLPSAGCARKDDAIRSGSSKSVSPSESPATARESTIAGWPSAGDPDTPATSDSAAEEGYNDAAVAGAATASGSSGSTSAKTDDATADELAAIARELEAIDRELDSLQMPSENDFSGIEDALF